MRTASSDRGCFVYDGRIAVPLLFPAASLFIFLPRPALIEIAGQGFWLEQVEKTSSALELFSV